MNEHFASGGSRLDGKLSPPSHHYLEYVSKCEPPMSSFLYQPVTPKEVKLEISLIPNNKSYQTIKTLKGHHSPRDFENIQHIY